MAFEFVVAVFVVMHPVWGIVPDIAVAFHINGAGFAENGKVEDIGFLLHGDNPLPLGGDAGFVEGMEQAVFEGAAIEQEVDVGVVEKAAFARRHEGDAVAFAAGDGLRQFQQFFQLDFEITAVGLGVVGGFVREQITTAHFGHALDDAVMSDFPFVLSKFRGGIKGNDFRLPIADDGRGFVHGEAVPPLVVEAGIVLLVVDDGEEDGVGFFSFSQSWRFLFGGEDRLGIGEKRIWGSLQVSYPTEKQAWYTSANFGENSFFNSLWNALLKAGIFIAPIFESTPLPSKKKTQ